MKTTRHTVTLPRRWRFPHECAVSVEVHPFLQVTAGAKRRAEAKLHFQLRANIVGGKLRLASSTLRAQQVRIGLCFIALFGRATDSESMCRPRKGYGDTRRLAFCTHIGEVSSYRYHIPLGLRASQRSMSKAIQTHYLPKKAYLSFFTKPGARTIYMYQRDQPPIELTIENAGRERNLYCYRDAEGNLNSDVEKWFERLESGAYPTLGTLNEALEDFDLSLEDWRKVSEFLAAQLLRTPAWRRKLEEMYGATAKAFMMKMASDDPSWDSINREAPSKFPDMDLGKLRRFVLSGEYDVSITGGLLTF